MISGMARYRHTVALDPVPRGWFDSCVEVGHRTLGEYLDQPIDPGFRLVDGAALHPGARYADADRAVELELLAWDSQAETAGRLRYVDGDDAVDATVRLSTAAAPRTVEMTADLRRLPGRRSPSLRAERVEVHADLARWWSGVDHRGSGPVISVRAWHRLYRATFDLTPEPGSGDRWAVTVTARVRGRTALRPLAALVLFGADRRIRTGFAARLDRAAAEWNSTLPDLLAKGPGELRDLIAAGLTAARLTRGARRSRP